MNRLHYLLQFFQDPKVAALGPTSKQVVEGVCEGIPENKDLNVLELGPGDGVVTRSLLRRLSPGSKVLALETNERFCEELKQWNDPRLIVINDKAQEFPRYMEDAGIKRFDRIISGVPCSMLSHEERTDFVMNFHRNLVEGGASIIYQLSPLMKKYIRNFFELEDLDVKRNGILPMFIMKGQKKHSKDPVERDMGPDSKEE